MATAFFATARDVAAAESRLVADGFPAADVRALTLLYLQYIHALGRKVRVRQRVVGTACVLFQRFFHVQTLLSHDPLLVAPTVLWMASKIEESGVSPKHIVKAMGELGLRGNAYEVAHLLAAEYVLLEVLMPFGLAVDHPHAPLARLFAEADLRRHIGVERSDCLVQTATFLVNDAYRTPDLALCYSPRTVALSCAHAAGLLEHVPLDNLLPEPSAEEHDAIERVAASLHALYDGQHTAGGSGGGRAAAAMTHAREALAAAHERLTDVWAGRLDIESPAVPVLTLR